VKLANERVREPAEPVLVVLERCDPGGAATEVLDPLEPDVDFDLCEFASVPAAVAGAVVAGFDDVVEDRDGRAGVPEDVDDAPVDAFDVAFAVGVEIVRCRAVVRCGALDVEVRRPFRIGAALGS